MYTPQLHHTKQRIDAVILFIHKITVVGMPINTNLETTDVSGYLLSICPLKISILQKIIRALTNSPLLRMVLDNCHGKTCTLYLSKEHSSSLQWQMSYSGFLESSAKKKNSIYRALHGFWAQHQFFSELWRRKVFRKRDGVIHWNCICASLLGYYKGYGFLTCFLCPLYLQNIYCATEYTQQ